MRYTSATRILGLPLVDVRIADRGTARGVARGWIAIGDVAIGNLVALGGLAVAPFAAGGLAAGLVPLGGVALGVLALGGLGIGIWSIGGAAIAWIGALGGFAAAAQFALGGAAFATHANDAAATAYFSALPFTAARGALMHSRWLILLAFLPALVLLVRRSASSS